MALFKKFRPKLNAAFKEKAAKSIAGRLVTVQIKAAKWLQHWQDNCSSRKRNLTLALLAMVWFTYSLYLLINAIIG